MKHSLDHTLIDMINDLKSWAEDIMEPSDLLMIKPHLGMIKALAKKFPEGRPNDDSEDFEDYWEQLSECIDAPFMTFGEYCDAACNCIRKRIEATGHK